MALWNLVFTMLLLVLIMERKPPGIHTKIECEKVNRKVAVTI